MKIAFKAFFIWKYLVVQAYLHKVWHCRMHEPVHSEAVQVSHEVSHLQAEAGSRALAAVGAPAEIGVFPAHAMCLQQCSLGPAHLMQHHVAPVVLDP